MFPCGTPYGQEIGSEAMEDNMDKARAMLKASEYNGENVVILSPSDVPTIGPMGEITYDLLKKLGMNAGTCSPGLGDLDQSSPWFNARSSVCLTRRGE
jgi:peptide/nickel transport system substrate-binding protein